MGIRLNYCTFNGRRFQNLTFIKLHSRDGKRANIEVLCDCGVTKIVDWDNLRSGKTKSCGCKQHKEKWEGSGHTLRGVWTGIKQRCFNPRSQAYAWYGAKGVTVCEEWRRSYKSFYKWCMDNGWEEGLEIDKDIKGDGMIYSPETCTITTHAGNCAALRGRRKISKEVCDEIVNSKLSGRQLSKELGISRTTITLIRNHIYYDSSETLI